MPLRAYTENKIVQILYSSVENPSKPLSTFFGILLTSWGTTNSSILTWTFARAVYLDIQVLSRYLRSF